MGSTFTGGFVMGHIIFTLLRNDGQKPDRRQKGMGHFQTSITSPDGTLWDLEIPCEGTLTCYPNDREGHRKRGPIPSIALYAPRNALVPGPGDVQMEMDRRPVLVANIGGCTLCLQKGFAAVLYFGASVLLVSWDYPEFEHPSIES